MHVLRMLDAAYYRNGSTFVRPFTLEMQRSQRLAIRTRDAREARVLATMAAALVKATSGIVLIGEYDPRVQPAHCKALAAYVPHDPLPLAESSFDRFIAYRAALWNLDLVAARERAATLLARLNGIHEAFAYPIVAALLSEPALLVLDRPHAAFAAQLIEAAGGCAIFSTHVDEATAAHFDPVREAVQR